MMALELAQWMPLAGPRGQTMTKLILNRSVDKRPKSGECRTVYHNPAFEDKAPTVEQLLAQAAAESVCKAIDGDYFRGGFSPYPRHARR